MEFVYGVPPIMLAIAAFALPLFSLFIKDKRFYDGYALAFGTICLVTSTIILADVFRSGKPVIYPFGGWPPPIGILYEIDEIGAVLGFVVASVMLVIIAYSIWYLKGVDGYVWYYTLLLGLEAGMLGCVYTGDVFNLFVMLEVLAIAAYGLVAFYRSRPEAVEAAIKYGLIGAAATTIYFLALVFIYGSYGTLAMADIAMKSRGLVALTPSGSIFGNIVVSSAIAIGLALWAFTYKAALFPNHFWLPDAHPEAPAPVSAALSGLVVKVGVYAVARFMYTLFGRDSVLDIGGIRDLVLAALLALGIASAFVGAVMMMLQRDVKRLLAYSTVNHIGFIFMGLAIGFSTIPQKATILGLAAAVLHIINHSIGKSLLFMSTGAMIKYVGSRDLDKLRGLARSMPITTATTFVGALHLLGLPPLAGFFSKYLLYQAYMEAGQPFIAILVVVISAISAPGYFKLLYPLISSNGEARGKDDILPASVFIALSLAIVLIPLLLPLGFYDMILTTARSLVTLEAVQRYIKAFIDCFMSLMPR